MEVLAAIGFEAHRFHCREFVDGCEDSRGYKEVRTKDFRVGERGHTGNAGGKAQGVIYKARRGLLRLI
jgi:hypothetical protein